jgi:hypothetical protein
MEVSGHINVREKELLEPLDWRLSCRADLDIVENRRIPYLYRKASPDSSVA